MREGGAGGKGRAPGLCLTPNLLCARDTKETITDKGDPPTSETPEMLTFQLGGSDRKLFSHFVSSRLNSGTECTPSSPTAHTCPFFLGRPPPRLPRPQLSGLCGLDGPQSCSRLLGPARSAVVFQTVLTGSDPRARRAAGSPTERKGPGRRRRRRRGKLLVGTGRGVLARHRFIV